MKQPRFSLHSELPLPTLPELIPSSSQRYLFEQRPAKLCCGSLAGQGVLPGEGCVGSDQQRGANILKRGRGKTVRGTISHLQGSYLKGAKKQSRDSAGARQGHLLRILRAAAPAEGAQRHPVCTMRNQRQANLLPSSPTDSHQLLLSSQCKSL